MVLSVFMTLSNRLGKIKGRLPITESQLSFFRNADETFFNPKIKSDTVSTVSPSIRHEVMGPNVMIVVLILSFKPAFTKE